MKKLLIITQKVDIDDQLLGFFVEWIRRLAVKFDRITVLCLERNFFDLPPNVQVISLGKDRGIAKIGQLFNFYKNIFGLQGNYDTVFVHMNPIWVVLGGWFWHLTGKKVVFWYTTKGITLKLRFAEFFADTILTASKESFRLASRKVIVTGHGIDSDLFRPGAGRLVSSDKLKILSVGRIAPVKNYEILIEAVKILLEKDLPVFVTIIGEPALIQDHQYAQMIKSKIKQLGVEGHFNFLGKVPHRKLPAYYQNHDIFVHLSKTGSLDKTVLEAMACGLSIVSSNDAARSFLPPENIFYENDPSDLAAKIVSASKQPRSFREYVMKYHDLDKLIANLSGHL